ncbi:hypothetical protein [Stigmatella ashevillensis]|nr:hypothetical protein [Stigmatella ashevillena]
MLLAACSAAHLQPFKELGTPGRFVQAYSQLTGASSRFSFFAPGVSPELKVSFEVQKASGEVIQDDFNSESEEMNLRVHSMLIRFGLKDIQDLLARSWGAAMFGRHPDARAVTVIVNVFDLPSMEGYRAGERPAWKEQYRAVLERRVASRSASLPQVLP